MAQSKISIIAFSLGDTDEASNFFTPLKSKEQLSVASRILIDTYELSVDDVLVTLYHLKQFSLDQKEFLDALCLFIDQQKPDFYVAMGQGELQHYDQSFTAASEGDPPIVGGLFWHLLQHAKTPFVNTAYVSFKREKESYFASIALKITRIGSTKHGIVILSPEIEDEEGVVNVLKEITGLLKNENPTNEGFQDIFPGTPPCSESDDY